MSVTADFPSSAAFDQIQEALNDEATRKDAIKTGKAIFAFTLKNDKGATESWHIDLKQNGAVGKGVGTKPTCTSSPLYWQELVMCSLGMARNSRHGQRVRS